MDCNQDVMTLMTEVELPFHFARTAGILKYMRESYFTDHGVTFSPQSEAPLEFLIKCEYCGEELSLSLDEMSLHSSEPASPFCCEPWEKMYRLLMKMRNMRERKSEDIPTTNNGSVTQPLTYRKKEDILSMFPIDPTKEDKSESRHFADHVIEVPVLDTAAMESNAIIFCLSCPPKKNCIILPENKQERKATVLDATFNKDEIQVSVCNHEPLDFGLCRHQGDYPDYPDGLKFLLALDDGSAHVFYPSGLLAILVTVTSYGRVCMVFDDAPGQPMRALFQSNGRGTCYHPNGNIWLIFNKYGGQCLDQEGARVRRWMWHRLMSTPLRPIFLSVNKSIGIRVLGKQQIFVSFLSNSRQAKFNVGAWCDKGSCKEVQKPQRLAKDELLALASRIKTKLLIEKIHRFMSAPSHPKPSNAVLAPHLHLEARKLFEAGKEVEMDEDDRGFLQGCLEECL